jgi:predicted nucleic acid-binding protein
MRAVLFDASIYIAVLRARDDASLALRQIAGGETVWLSSVVLEELYAGANPRNRRVVEALELDFNKVRRNVVPNLSDWIQTGKLLASLAATYDYEQIGRGRLTNDALIAVSAGRRGITVITANAKDFARLAEFRPFRWRVSRPPAN